MNSYLQINPIANPKCISDYNNQQAGDDNVQSICFILRGSDQGIVGVVPIPEG
ncbi:MAG: hypothetical protein ACQEQQ_06270 [Chloroflexota bacterium]